jgi:hypothetical protein
VERVYKSDGTRDLNEEMLVSGPHIESRVRQLEKTSIRHPTRVLTVPFVTPLDCPPEIDETKKSYSKFTLEHQIMKTIGEDTKKYTLDPKDPVFSAIVEFLHAHSRPEWKHIQVTDIKYKLTGKNNAFRKYFIYVNPKAPGGTCCLNRTPNEFGIRQHKSAPVYFTLTCQGLRQRCNAGAGKKNRVAVNGKIKPCTQFESNVMPMRPTILMRIFPPTSVPPSLHVSRAPSRSQSIVVAADALTRASSNSDNLGQTQNNSVCHEDSCVDVQKSVNALVLSDSVTAEVPSTLKPAEDSAPDPLQLAQQKDHEQKLKLLRWINATKLSSVKKSSSFTNKSQNMYGPIKRTFSDRKTMFNNSSDVRLEVASKFIADKLQVKTKSHPYVHPSERQSPTISATG